MIPVETSLPFLPRAACSCLLSACSFPSAQGGSGKCVAKSTGNTLMIIVLSRIAERAEAGMLGERE